MYKLLLGAALYGVVLFAVSCHSQPASKHNLVLVVEATEGMAPTLNELYWTFEFLQTRRAALHKEVKAFILATFNSEGSTNIQSFRKPRQVANALPSSLSARSPSCTSQVDVYGTILETLKTAGSGCADIHVVTQSLPGDLARLDELQRLADEKNAKINIYTVHSCENDQSSYDGLARRTGGARIHFRPASRLNMRNYLTRAMSAPAPLLLLDTVLESAGGRIAVPFKATSGMAKTRVYVRCPKSPAASVAVDASGASFSAQQIGDVKSLVAESLSGGTYMIRIASALGACRVKVTTTHTLAAHHYRVGAGWHHIPSTDISGGLSQYILLSGSADFLSSVVSAKLYDSLGQLASSFQKSGSLALGGGAVLIFGPLQRPEGRSVIKVETRSVDGHTYTQVADQCRLDVPAGALDEFQGRATSEGGVGLENPDRLGEPTPGFSECRENEIYRSCGSECRETCEGRPRRVCNFVCIQGCFCRSGFVLNNDTKRCVRRSECPRTQQPPVLPPVVPTLRPVHPPPASGCPKPVLPNGNVLVLGGLVIRAGAISFALCDPGYKLHRASIARRVCSASGEWIPSANQYCVSAVSPPVIANSQLLSYGSCQFLPCTATGSPRPLIQWQYKDSDLSAPLPANMLVQRNGTLRICDGLPEQSGKYTCTAANRGGTAVRNFPIFFGCRPEIIRTDLPKQEQFCITLPCRTSCSPAPTLNWYRDNRRIPIDNRDYILDGTSLQVCNGRPALAGVYECRTSSSAGSDSRSYQLAFNPAPTSGPGPQNDGPSPPTPSGVNAAVRAINALRKQLVAANSQQAATEQLLRTTQRQLATCRASAARQRCP